MRNAGNLCDNYWFATKYHTLFTPCKGWEIGFWNCQADGTFPPNILVTFSSNIEGKMCSIYSDFDSKCWIMDFFSLVSTHEKKPQNNYRSSFSNIYLYPFSSLMWIIFEISQKKKISNLANMKITIIRFLWKKKSSSIIIILSSRKWPKYLTEHYINQFKRYLL